jgi:hypothetical protein
MTATDYRVSAVPEPGENALTITVPGSGLITKIVAVESSARRATALVQPPVH